MKILRFALPLILTVGGLTACSQTEPPIPREQLVANITPVLNMEKRVDRMRFYTSMLGSMGEISGDKTEKLKKHFDVYYVYYLASNVHLAKGNMDSYLEHVRLAERELDAIEQILKDGLVKEREESGEGNELQSGL